MRIRRLGGVGHGIRIGGAAGRVGQTSLRGTAREQIVRLGSQPPCDIARRHQATPAQVTLAWAMQRGFSVIPSSTKRENLASNLLAQSLRLTDDDMARIAALERNGREVNPDGLAPQWD